MHKHVCTRVCAFSRAYVHVYVQYIRIGKSSCWPLVGRHVRRFPAAELQNPSPQSLSSALISSYRHGACGQGLHGFQTLSSATVTAGFWRSEGKARVRPAHTRDFISETSGLSSLRQGLRQTFLAQYGQSDIIQHMYF